jgi:hypothetical protein
MIQHDGITFIDFARMCLTKSKCYQNTSKFKRRTAINHKKVFKLFKRSVLFNIRDILKKVM